MKKTKQLIKIQNILKIFFKLKLYEYLINFNFFFFYKNFYWIFFFYKDYFFLKNKNLKFKILLNLKKKFNIMKSLFFYILINFFKKYYKLYIYINILFILKWIFLNKYKPITPGYRWKININNNYKFNNKYNKFFFFKKKIKYYKYIYNFKNMYCLISIKKIYNSYFLGIFKCINGFIFLNKLINGNFLGDYFKNFFIPKTLIKKNLIGSYTSINTLIVNFFISNIFLQKNKSQLSNSSGTYCQILEFKKNFNLVLIKMPSNKIKFININFYCILGRNSNILHNNEIYAKASFWYNLNKKPKVRGVAKNPVDHPHGGRTKTCKPEVSPWGWVTKYSH